MYRRNMDVQLGPNLQLIPHHLREDIDRTRAGDQVDPKFRSKSYKPNMDLEPDPEQEQTAPSLKVRHR